MSTLGDLRVALVHDELTRRGGAELVFEELVRLFPQADIYALYAGRPVMQIDGVRRIVHTSSLQRLPRFFRRHPRRLLPLLPYAAEQFDLADYDLVISSASAFAKGVVTRAHVPHVSYCHTPTRYLWDDAATVLKARRGVSRWLGGLLLHGLRLIDFAAAQRVDHFVANSQWTQERIQKYYRRPSRVVYPPIDTQFFTPGNNASAHKPPQSFLCVGRLTETKRFEQAIAVCEKLKLPLTIVGVGEDEARLRSMAGPMTSFVGSVSREELRDLYRGARAVIVPGTEDFGMVAAEAHACGTPVIGYGVGGSAEVVRPGETGILYAEPVVEALAEAIRQFVAKEASFTAEGCQAQALRFSRERFRSGLTEILVAVMGKRAV